MKTLIPWDKAEPRKQYVASHETDLRKSFKALRAKLTRMAKKKARQERRK